MSTENLTKMSFAIPDYSNREATNRIPGNGGSWTVDRDGYVRAAIFITNANSANGTCSILINNQEVVSDSSTSLQARTAEAILPVKKGDVITLNENGDGSAGHASFYCFYIPPLIRYLGGGGN